MAAGVSIIGLQWGDEAKGKLVDLLSPEFDIVVRYQGGANAGHTVVIGKQTYKLHHLPSGILHQGVMNVVTAGVVIEPETILKEIDSLKERGVAVSDKNLLLSDRAHVVFPWHIAEDAILNEEKDAGEPIGTTNRGIGPTYRDKLGRMDAVRLGDMYRTDFAAKLAGIVARKHRMLAALAPNFERLEPVKIHERYHAFAERLRPYVADTTSYLLDAVDEGRKLLFEGAQGAMLDVDHGTYPYVTSSNSSGVGVSAGSGVPGRWIKKVIGVAKCYTTRVGGGPFPTEQNNATGDKIREVGKEYGTTTGRPRRCGWFDAVAVRYAARLSGADALSMMMLDVLSEFDEIQIGVAYELDGKRIDHVPSHVDDLRRVRPVYETLPGWRTDVTKARRLEDLPARARAYLDRVSQLVGRPVEIVSIGPDREQTIFAGREAK
jgi:adenylosuccinate synthase